MIIELILALIIGVTAGVITGLIPGIHINLIAISLLAISPFLLSFTSPLALAILIIAMAITHTFLDFIPSIFLGAPDEDTGLSVLPGHKMLNQGKAYEAIIHTLFGSSLGIIIILILTPVFIFLLPKIFNYIKLVMFLMLITASIYLIFKEKKSKSWALTIFILSGFLGLASLNLTIKNSLLPLLTGLFGGSSLIISVIKKQKIPKQKIFGFEEIKKKIRKSKLNLIKPSIAAILAAPLCSFLPSLGSSQAAVIGSDITGETDKKQFLTLLGSINTIVIGLSFITLYTIQKTRTGAAVAISEFLTKFQPSDLFIILGTIIISGAISFFLTIYISQFVAKKIHKIKYNKLSLIVLSFLAILVLIFSSWLGFLVFIIACATGLTAILLGIRRTHLMGAMMIPTIIFYIPF